MAERTNFKADLAYSFFAGLIIYPVFGHWVWGGGWLAQLGYMDFAGSSVVHLVGAYIGLAGTIILGKRRIGSYPEFLTGPDIDEEVKPKPAVTAPGAIPALGD